MDEGGGVEGGHEGGIEGVVFAFWAEGRKGEGIPFGDWTTVGSRGWGNG